MWCSPNIFIGDVEYKYNFSNGHFDSSNEAWKKVDEIIENGSNSACTHVYGYLDNFENVKNHADKFPEKSKETYQLEIVFDDLENVDDVLPIFDAYCHWWKPYLLQRTNKLVGDPPPEIGTCEKIPSLLYLAANACIKHRCNMKTLPNDMKWLVQGLYYRNKKSGTKPDIGIKLEIASSYDQLDEAGKKSFDVSKAAFYSPAAQKNWRQGKMQLKDGMFSCELGVPDNTENATAAVRALNAKIYKSANMVESGYDKDELGDRWGFQSSAGGFTRLASYFVPKPYSTTVSAITWNHLKHARSGFKHFVTETRAFPTQLWAQDKYRMSIGIGGPTMQELDLAASEFIKIYRSFTNALQPDVRCWYSFAINRETSKDSSFNIAAVKQLMADSTMCTATIQVSHTINKMSNARLLELSAQINNRINALPVLNPHNPYEYIKKHLPPAPPVPPDNSISGKLKNLLGASKPEDPRLVELMHLTERAGHGTIEFSIHLCKGMQQTNGKFVQDWDISTGCRLCSKLFYYRSGVVHERTCHLSNMFCCVHKSVLLAQKLKDLTNKEMEFHLDALVGLNIIGNFAGMDWRKSHGNPPAGLVDAEYVQEHVMAGLQYSFQTNMLIGASLLQQLTKEAHYVEGMYDVDEDDEGVEGM